MAGIRASMVPTSAASDDGSNEETTPNENDDQ